MKIGIVYCREGQQTREEMFANSLSSCSPGFLQFVENLGQKVTDWKSWKKYRGDMSPPCVGYYDEWMGMEGDQFHFFHNFFSYLSRVSGNQSR